eukprot:g14707.t1
MHAHAHSSGRKGKNKRPKPKRGPQGTWPHSSCRTSLVPANTQHSASDLSLSLSLSVQISDAIQRSRPDSYLAEFRSLEYALMICCFVGAMGGAAFLATAVFIERDRRKAELYTR